MKHWIVNSVSALMLASLVASPALAAFVTYGFGGVDIGGTVTFTGSFTFDTGSDAIVSASLQSTGAGPTEVWAWSNPPGSYYGASLNLFDLVFRSPSAAFPVATNPSSEGDIFGIGFVSPLDGLAQDDFVAVYETTLGFINANGVTLPLIGNDLVAGCAAPGVSSCSSAVPEPSTLALLALALSALGLFARSSPGTVLIATFRESLVRSYLPTFFRLDAYIRHDESGDRTLNPEDTRRKSPPPNEAFAPALQSAANRLLAFLSEHRVGFFVYLCLFCRAQPARIATLRSASLCVSRVRLVLYGESATRKCEIRWR